MKNLFEIPEPVLPPHTAINPAKKKVSIQLNNQELDSIFEKCIFRRSLTLNETRSEASNANR